MSADVTTNNDGESPNAASIEQLSRSTRRKWFASTILVPVLYAVLGLSVLGATFVLQSRKPEPPKPKPDPENPTGQSSNKASNHSGNSEHLARVKLALQRAQFEIDLADAKQLELQVPSAEAELQQLIRNTLSDSVGKRIAGNEELFLRFRALKHSVEIGQPNPSTPVSTIERDARNVMGEGLQRHNASLVRTRTSLDEAFQFYTQRLNYLRKMRESAASLPPSEHTLQSAIFLHESSLASRAEAAANDAAHDLGESLDKEYSDAVTQRDDSADLVEGLESQLEQIKSGKPLTSEITDAVLLPQASRDDYKRELEKIRTHLVAFTTPGYVQPESADRLVYRNVKQPMSYSALQRIGALNATDEGRATLLRVGGSKSATQRNDRPLGSFPRMNSVEQLRKDKDLEARVIEAQQLLRRYGPLLVEDGLLLP